MTAKKRMTLRELAESIGVHSSTVSRVMNPRTRHLISADVVETVLKAAKQSKYSPNISAATLRTRRSGIIGVVLPDIANPVFSPILHGIEQELAGRGLVPLIANGEGDKKRQRFVIDQMMGRQVDGLILATSGRKDPVLEHCVAEGLPVVVVNRREESGQVSCIVGDNLLAMEFAVAHLVELGHTNIAHISGPTDLSTGFERKNGFLAAARKHGLKKSETPVKEAEAYTRDAGRVSCLSLLEKYPHVTAVVAANDLLALGCYDALKERNLNCPGDISIVGHNDMLFMDAVSPPMTTIRVPLHAMGAGAASLILDILDGKASGHVSIMLRPELIVRSSTSTPRNLTTSLSS